MTDSWIVAAVVDKLVAISGMAPRYMSVASGPMAQIMPIEMARTRVFRSIFLFLNLTMPAIHLCRAAHEAPCVSLDACALLRDFYPEPDAVQKIMQQLAVGSLFAQSSRCLNAAELIFYHFGWINYALSMETLSFPPDDQETLSFPFVKSKV
ncbi:hypothetical protein V6582_15280 [Agrobacterium vitis]|uniref:hypothetical protein n=1 Tax=Agrobacterium vitis TaxID=373 RepID=UPI001F37DA90|nr:hypothetical protein [Agrobacterium vitis]